jgi:hypothetical protein
MNDALTRQDQSLAVNARLQKFFARVAPVRGRLIFGIDATASRQPTWDLATGLQGQMFAAVSGLDVQLAYYRGDNECVRSRWLSDSRSLSDIMSRVFCKSGVTQIGRILRHTRQENQHEKVNALVIISDACEERPGDLYDAARALHDVPAIFFQEGHDAGVGSIYAEIARITGGAVACFDAGAADRLADLLRAVGAFASGGIAALEGQKTEAARLLLTQISKR